MNKKIIKEEISNKVIQKFNDYLNKYLIGNHHLSHYNDFDILFNINNIEISSDENIILIRFKINVDPNSIIWVGEDDEDEGNLAIVGVEDYEQNYALSARDSTVRGVIWELISNKIHQYSKYFGIKYGQTAVDLQIKISDI